MTQAEHQQLEECLEDYLDRLVDHIKTKGDHTPRVTVSSWLHRWTVKNIGPIRRRRRIPS